MSASHLELNLRKSLVVRIKTAMLVEALPLPHASEDAMRRLHSLLTTIYGKADGLSGTGTAPLDISIRKLAGVIRRERIPGMGPAFDELRRRHDQLVAELRAVDCADCTRKRRGICRGERPHDDATVHEGGSCIDEFKTLAQFVEQRALELYRATGIPFPRPAIHLSTATGHAAVDTQLLGEFNISGWTQVHDGVGGPVSEIGLAIKEEAFDWQTLGRVLYVLAHEFVCHGYQGLRGGTRSNVDHACSWSEGWMDALAYALTSNWLNGGGKGLPEWVKQDAATVMLLSTEVHKRRYKASTTLKRYQQQRRAIARIGFDRLRDALNGVGPSPGIGAERIARFSALLNLHNMPARAREDFTQTLSNMLVHRSPQTFELVVRLCSEFLLHQDAQRLWRDLKKLE